MNVMLNIVKNVLKKLFFTVTFIWSLLRQIKFSDLDTCDGG